jgi:hypothetical protein
MKLASTKKYWIRTIPRKRCKEAFTECSWVAIEHHKNPNSITRKLTKVFIFEYKLLGVVFKFHLTSQQLKRRIITDINKI